MHLGNGVLIVAAQFYPATSFSQSLAGEVRIRGDNVESAGHGYYRADDTDLRGPAAGSAHMREEPSELPTRLPYTRLPYTETVRDELQTLVASRRLLTEDLSYSIRTDWSDDYSLRTLRGQKYLLCTRSTAQTACRSRCWQT